ncbi:MAG TPA: amidohydrolase [Pyrinomonadaceae bacterium]|jgi:5-methylthioadenosine/S-adenosylhomocysteine deaminase|nr:amidohydrolase [Pyrinomonadaceae bacterium]
MDKLRSPLAVLLVAVTLAFTSFSQVSPLDPNRDIPARKPLVNRFGKTPVDLLISGGTVVTMNAKHELIEDGAVAIYDGAIFMIGRRADIAPLVVPRRVINAAGKVVIPGLINTHTHVPMSLFRGISDDLDLNDWLTKYIFPAEAKNVDEPFVRAGTRLGLAEMIRGGTTTYCDMYYFEDAIADETKKAGVRGVLGETIIDFPVADNKTNAQAMAYTERFIEKWTNDPLIVPAAAPHAPYTVSTDHLKAIRAQSDRLNSAVVIHVAETKKERDDINKQYGDTPVTYLSKIGFLSNRTIAAHTVWITDKEIDLLKRIGVGSAHNPQSNMKLASGVAPIPEMLAKDVAVGLGTDGAASNNDLDMWEEMDTAAKLHKEFSGDPKVVTAEQAFEMATIRGARALHLDSITGSLEEGKRADIAIVDMDSLNQTPYFNVYSALVYSTKAADVRTVVINGRVVMLDRRLLTLNESVIKKDANAYRDKIIKSLKQ